MFSSIFDTAVEGAGLTPLGAAGTMGVAFALGVLISLIYMKTHKEQVFNQGFVLTLVMLPVIVALMILLIGSNVARAFSLAGAFSIIRFRTAMGDPKDIAYVFFAMAVGLALGVGLMGYAVLFAAVLCLMLLLLHRVDFGAPKESPKVLRIVIPEDLDYAGVFDDLFEKYTSSASLQRVKTTDLGSLYVLTYHVVTKNSGEEKNFIDELRCRNGNLSISLAQREAAEQ